MKYLWIVWIVLFASAPIVSAATPLEQLKSQAGKWEGTGDQGIAVNVEYRLISGGTAVLETMNAQGKEDMVTVYYVDRGTLMATHFCAADNHPRLKAIDRDPKRIVLEFLDATNIISPETDHITRLALNLTEPDHITQEWTHRVGGKETTSVFQLSRELEISWERDYDCTMHPLQARTGANMEIVRAALFRRQESDDCRPFGPKRKYAEGERKSCTCYKCDCK